jgi:hypothetical protein
MPISTTKMDYAMFFFTLIIFTIAFFLWSDFGDLHYSSNSDPSQKSYISIVVYIAPIFTIYSLLFILVLPGKPKLREIDKRLLLLKIKTRKKIREGLEEYQRWRSQKKH